MIAFLQIGNPIEPVPVKFSFAAPGWYVLGGLLVVLLLVLVFLMWRHYQRNKYRRKALQWLAQQEELLIEAKQFTELLYTADTLMKRIAVQRYGREIIADLQGAEWMAFLNETSNVAFDKKDEQQLTYLYSKEEINEQEINSFVDKARKWIRTHKKRY